MITDIHRQIQILIHIHIQIQTQNHNQSQNQTQTIIYCLVVDALSSAFCDEVEVLVLHKYIVVELTGFDTLASGHL